MKESISLFIIHGNAHGKAAPLQGARAFHGRRLRQANTGGAWRG